MIRVNMWSMEGRGSDACARMVVWQINAALRAIHNDLLANDEGMGPRRSGVGASDVTRLDGRWRCRITSHAEAVSYTVKTDIWCLDTHCGEIGVWWRA